ncbi:MAG: group II intron reverse transcriptase/maturase [Sphingobacteriales bacterium 50-39]|nr:group II intron reverse transcriptase/maturase [Sphingobacteriales bacterium]OJW60512.1 MAG: group II intron reverse transcriptase/maturase [Sphingobacteriales bacterium 50-39]
MRRAYEQVILNKGSGGVDGIELPAFKAQVEQEWPLVRQKIQEGRYEPKPVRRVAIPKPGGGLRMLGIPTLMDRMIQQAIGQVLMEEYDSTFSKSSYGFRPGRNAHQAILQAKQYMNQGYNHVVDIDLEKFFDRVNHDCLLNLLSQRIKDKPVLKLIQRYLRSGVMEGGMATVNREGTPQGGPLSPVLSNILLDKLDKELESRGHRFVRYADDLQVYVKSERSATRVLASVSCYIEKELKLVVNRTKSKVTRPWGSKLLGYSFYHRKGEIGPKIADNSIEKYKTKVREITSRSRPVAMYKRYDELRSLNRGWYNYFKLTEARDILGRLDSWVRSRLRLCYWKQWKNPRTRVQELVRLGTPEGRAYQWGNTRKGYWRTCHSPILKRALNSAFLKREGYLPLKELGTFKMFYSNVPPYTEPYVRWLEGTVQEIILHLLLNYSTSRNVLPGSELI